MHDRNVERRAELLISRISIGRGINHEMMFPFDGQITRLGNYCIADGALFSALAPFVIGLPNLDGVEWEFKDLTVE